MLYTSMPGHSGYAVLWAGQRLGKESRSQCLLSFLETPFPYDTPPVLQVCW